MAINRSRNKICSEESYFCTEEPTWKLISLSVPPMNLPLIRLPFFSSKESAQERDAPSQREMTNSHFSFNFTLTSPLRVPVSFSLVQFDWDGWGSHDRTQLVLLGHISGFLFGLLRQVCPFQSHRHIVCQVVG